jgi:hypothetical protein
MMAISMPRPALECQLHKHRSWVAGRRSEGSRTAGAHAELIRAHVCTIGLTYPARTCTIQGSSSAASRARPFRTAAKRVPPHDTSSVTMSSTRPADAGPSAGLAGPPHVMAGRGRLTARPRESQRGGHARSCTPVSRAAAAPQSPA